MTRCAPGWRPGQCGKAHMGVQVQFLTRSDCGLCDTARAVVDSVLADLPEQIDVQLSVVDIDSDAQLQAKYDWDVPVVLINGRQHSFHRVDPHRFAQALRAAHERG